jgi:hypothetical protein
MFRLMDHLREGTQCGLRDLISRQTKPKTPTALSMNTLPFFTQQALFPLEKIVQWNPNRPLARRANAILLWAQGKPKAEIARVLQAARSSVNRWIKWYLSDDLGQYSFWGGSKIMRFLALAQTWHNYGTMRISGYLFEIG